MPVAGKHRTGRVAFHRQSGLWLHSL